MKHDLKNDPSAQMMTVEQIRAARAMLRWPQTELARRAGLALITVKRLETEYGGVSGEARGKAKAALESAGVIFEDANDEAVGVRLRRTAVRRDEKVIGLAQNREERAREEAEVFGRLDRAIKMTRVTVEAVKRMRETGASSEEIASHLVEVAAHLCRDDRGSSRR